MTTSNAWAVPFVLGPQNLAIDAVTAFVVSVLLACMVNAEAQAFTAAFLGDSRIGAKDRFHFNAFLHISLLGSICYLVDGFGWPRAMDIDRSKLAHPRLYTVIIRFSGPLANLMLAGIGGSFVLFMNMMTWDPGVFLMVIGVNVTTAVYHLIPLPPLAMGSLVCELMSPDDGKTRRLLLQAGPYLVLALAMLERLNPQGTVSPYLDPVIKAIFAYISSI